MDEKELNAKKEKKAKEITEKTKKVKETKDVKELKAKETKTTKVKTEPKVKEAKKTKAKKEAKVKGINKTDESKESKIDKMLSTNISLETYILGTALVITFCLSIIFFLNLVVRDSNIFEIDTSASKLHKLSKESRQILRNVDENIEIKVDKRLQYKQIRTILDQVVKENSRIKVVDAVQEEVNGEVLENHPTTIFVQATDREDMAVSFFDLEFDGHFKNFETKKEYSMFEQCLINSIISVTNAETVKTASVAFLTGHKEPELNTELLTLYTELRSFGLMPITLNLKKDKIPANIKTIAILGLRDDLTVEEYTKLMDFQKRGGSFVFGVAFEKDNQAPNFNKLLSSYGVKIPAGSVLEYRDKNRYEVRQENDIIRKFNNIVLPIVSREAELTHDMSLENTAPIFFFPSKIDFEKTEELEKKNLTFQNHIMTSDKAIFKKDIVDSDISDYELPKDAKTDIFILGTIATKRLDEDKSSKAIIYSNYLFMTDFMIRDFIETDMILMYDNLRLSKNTFSELSDLKDKQIELKKQIVVSQYSGGYDVFSRDRIITYLIYGIPTLAFLTFGVARLYLRGYFEKYGYSPKKKNTDI